MDALAAITTPDFIASRWCDQEVGVAIGRGKLVIPLRQGADPHGFMGKYQGMQIVNVVYSLIAEKICEILKQHPMSATRMADALVERLARSGSWAAAKENMTLVEKIPALNASQVTRLIQAIDENSEVGNAFGVPGRIRSLVERIGETT